MTDGIWFRVAGSPIGKARPRVTSRGAYMPTAYRQWLDVVKREALAYWAEHEECADKDCAVRWYDPAHHAICLTLVFRLPDRRRRDLDNLAGAVMDALNGVLWRDDSQIVRLAAEKHIAPKGEWTGVEVRAWIR